MDRYRVLFYRDKEVLACGHGYAQTADEAEEKAEFALLLMYSEPPVWDYVEVIKEDKNVLRLP